MKIGKGFRRWDPGHWKKGMANAFQRKMILSIERFINMRYRSGNGAFRFDVFLRDIERGHELMLRCPFCCSPHGGLLMHYMPYTNEFSPISNETNNFTKDLLTCAHFRSRNRLTELVLRRRPGLMMVNSWCWRPDGGRGLLFLVGQIVDSRQKTMMTFDFKYWLDARLSSRPDGLGLALRPLVTAPMLHVRPRRRRRNEIVERDVVHRREHRTRRRLLVTRVEFPRFREGCCLETEDARVAAVASPPSSVSYLTSLSHRCPFWSSSTGP